MITSNYLILTNYITLIFFSPGVCHKVNRERQTITHSHIHTYDQFRIIS